MKFHEIFNSLKKKILINFQCFVIWTLTYRRISFWNFEIFWPHLRKKKSFFNNLWDLKKNPIRDEFKSYNQSYPCYIHTYIYIHIECIFVLSLSFTSGWAKSKPPFFSLIKRLMFGLIFWFSRGTSAQYCKIFYS